MEEAMRLGKETGQDLGEVVREKADGFWLKHKKKVLPAVFGACVTVSFVAGILVTLKMTPPGIEVRHR